MEKLDRVREIDEDIFGVFKNFMDNFSEISKVFAFPQTLSAFMNFITSTNFIKEGIIELAYTDNTYSLNILLRSLIEQFLKFQFIWMKFLENKDDTIGADYWQFYSYSEDVDYGKAWNKVYNIINHIPEKDPIEIIKEANPNFADLSSTELKQKVSQFNYRNVIEFIVNSLHNNSYAIPSFVLKLIPEYSDLSSFVHGGPNTRRQIFSVSNEEERQEEIIRFTELAVQIANTTKLFTYLAIYQYDKTVAYHYNQTNDLIKKFRNQPTS